MKTLQIVEDCNRRMLLANSLIQTNYDLSVVMWREAFDRKNATIEAAMQAYSIHHTTVYPADLRVELCRN